MIKLDYLYVAGWSLWADIRILLRTVAHVLARRGMWADVSVAGPLRMSTHNGSSSVSVLPHPREASA